MCSISTGPSSLCICLLYQSLGIREKEREEQTNANAENEKQWRAVQCARSKEKITKLTQSFVRPHESSCCPFTVPLLFQYYIQKNNKLSCEIDQSFYKDKQQEDGKCELNRSATETMVPPTVSLFLSTFSLLSTKRANKIPFFFSFFFLCFVLSNKIL